MSYNITDHLNHGQNGLESDPLRNFKFLVNMKRKVNGKPIGFKLGFTSVEGFNASTEVIPYRQGGQNTTFQQIPGQTQFSPITFQGGVLLGQRQKWDWFRELFSVHAGQGTGRAAGAAAHFRSDVDVVVLEHPVTKGVAANAPLVIRIFNAWPTSISYSPLSSTDNGLIVEQMTLVHEGFDVDWASTVADSK